MSKIKGKLVKIFIPENVDLTGQSIVNLVADEYSDTIFLVEEKSGVINFEIKEEEDV